MKGIILNHKSEGVQVMDKRGYFHYVNGHTDCPLGHEIEIPRGHCVFRFIRTGIPANIRTAIRRYPDTNPEVSGHESGGIRTAIRRYPDSNPEVSGHLPPTNILACLCSILNP